MPFLLRTLLIWSLALALPAQGLAAATMALCGPQHHDSSTRAGSLQVDTTDPMHQSGHAHAHDAASVAHAHHDGGAGAAEAGPASEVSVSDLADPADAHGCSACAACCSVGAIASSSPSLPVAVLTTTAFPALDFSVDAFATDGPDRPPRIALA